MKIEEGGLGFFFAFVIMLLFGLGIICAIDHYCANREIPAEQRIISNEDGPQMQEVKKKLGLL